MKNYVKLAADWTPPMLILGLLSYPFLVTDLDMLFAGWFFVKDAGWVFNHWALWHILYHYGNAPSILLATGGLSLFLLSFFWRQIGRYRKQALFAALLMIIGPGLIVNLGFKENWVRPRPCQVEDFGGQMAFHRLGEAAVNSKGKSFPSGHASAAFYLIFPFFLLRNTRPLWARTFLFAGLGYGLLMGICRMCQGAHFASDVIWAGGFVYLCGMFLYYGLGFNREHTSRSTQLSEFEYHDRRDQKSFSGHLIN